MGSPANPSPKLPPLGSNCALFSHNGPNALDAFMFEGVRPHVVPNKAKGNAYTGAVRYGHFYVVVEKDWEFVPWQRNFGLELLVPIKLLVVLELISVFIQGLPILRGCLFRIMLWKAGGLTTCGRPASCRNRHICILPRGLWLVSKSVWLIAVPPTGTSTKRPSAATSPSTARPCNPTCCPSKRAAFIRCHDGQPRFRRPILAMVGSTQLGKSMLAANVLQRIAVGNP